ncbi:hypothetical protein [Paraburkholderia kururiensis]|uniref:hypothetical protein n=1 Tax=Paraburkholderia kururiensis TaxID=984307 RepID=UPI0005A8CD28|nr:hypothetical protein [Paraburkholderia kururiensis]
MSFDYHTVSLPGGVPPQSTDRVFLGTLYGVANGAGAAGAAVNVPVTGLNLPAKYNVVVQPGQDATWFATGKTQSGFTVTLNPRLAANSIAAGTIDITITA